MTRALAPRPNPLRGIAVGVAAVTIVWWLFSDTYARYVPRPAGDSIIRFAHFGSFQDYELWRDLIASFEASYPDCRVRQEYVPGWYGRYDTKVRQQVLSDTLPDVVLMQMAPFGILADRFATVEELTALDGEPFDSGVLQPTGITAFSQTVEGVSQLRGLPVSGGNLQIFCNMECVKITSEFLGRDLPLPDDNWTVTEFASFARMLTRDWDGDGQLDQFGFWLPRWVYYLPFLWSFGADVSTDGATWSLSGESAERAFEFYRDLARDRRVCPKPAEVPQLIQDVGFLTGKVAMCVNGPWFQPFLDRTHLRDSYAVRSIPCGDGGRWTRVTWDGLCVSKRATAGRRRWAWRFVRHCLSEASQARIAQTGRALPALRAAMSAFDDEGRDERRHRFVQAMAYSRLQPRLPGFARMDRAIERHLDRFVSSESSLDATGFLAGLATDADVVAAFNSDRERN